jgi:hypothetical protein
MNDLSLQGQFSDESVFLSVLSKIIDARNQVAILRASLYTARLLPTRLVGPQKTLVQLLQDPRFRDIRGLVLLWLTRTGPFVDDNRRFEQDDYFEFEGRDVTDSGLGEATRRQKTGEPVVSFSFQGGTQDFQRTPLIVEHGLAEDRLGAYPVENLWTVEMLCQSAASAAPRPTSWQSLVERARERNSYLWIPDAVYTRSALSREPFDTVISDRALSLLSHLNKYMMGRNLDGSESQSSRLVIETHFTGDRALFSGESESNRREFARDLTFSNPDSGGADIFAHWHGKISHRVFRLHFEWPVPANVDRLKIVYLGPKITKS